MTVISSFKPLDKSQAITLNQLRAKESWEYVFDSIIYFNAPDFRLASDKTEFIESEDFPHISAMFLAAAMTDDITAIVNADIVVARGLRQVIEREFGRGCGALMSFRYEFHPENPDYKNAKNIDQGLDFFCSSPELWNMAYKYVPSDYRIGHIKWDNWLMNFFQHTLGSRFFSDITAKKCIFHPIHEERYRPHAINDVDDPVFCIGGFRSYDYGANI
jgi:hypothetical protein